MRKLKTSMSRIVMLTMTKQTKKITGVLNSLYLKEI